MNRCSCCHSMIPDKAICWRLKLSCELRPESEAGTSDRNVVNASLRFCQGCARQRHLEQVLRDEFHLFVRSLAF